MIRKLRYLFAGLTALARPFFLGAIGVGLGFSDTGGAGSAYLRYLLFPAMFPAVCLFFLYIDEKKFSAYRPLALLFESGSLTFLLVAAFVALKNPQKTALATGTGTSLLWVVMDFLVTLLITLFSEIVLISGSNSAILPPKEQ